MTLHADLIHSLQSIRSTVIAANMENDTYWLTQLRGQCLALQLPVQTTTEKPVTELIDRCLEKLMGEEA